MRLQQCVAKVVVLIVVAVCVAAAPVLAQDCPELVGQLPGGNGTAVAVSGDYAYLGFGGPPRLVVADVSVPSAPQLVGEITLSSRAYTRRVAVSGAYAYVLVGIPAFHGMFCGLYVIDVSTPSAPAYAGFFGVGGWGVAVEGEYAYVAARGGFHVIDVSTPSAPVGVGFLGTPGDFHGVAVAGSYAYVTEENWDTGESGLSVIDVSTPTAPVEVGFLDTPGDARDVAVAGAYAYVINENSLRVIDVSTPSTPVEVSFVEDGGGGRVAVSGGYAYVAGYVADVGTGLWVIDVSTPSAPVEAGFFPTQDAAEDVAISGDHVFHTAHLDGLYVFRECGLVFEDGFESGDTSSWSATVP
jgi:hypothetical protein